MPHGADRSLSRPQRRLAVFALYGSAAGAAWLWQAGGMRRTPTAVAISALILVSLCAFAALFVGTRYWRWGNAPDQQLDEYEVATRNIAYLNAYRLVGAVTLLGLVWADIAKDFGAWRPSENLYQVLIWTWLVVVLTLPGSIVAWMDRATPE